MDNGVIKKIQKKILDLLPESHRNNPGRLLVDSCSEVSRLVASWIIALDKSSRVLIIKGINVCDTKKAHDILIVINGNNNVYIIDPTIWQFFPQSKSILVAMLEDVDTAYEKIKEVYGGEWSVSEESIQLDEITKNKYLDVISRNVIENLK